MPYNAWLSIWGLYNYDNTIFDNLVIPSQLNKSILIPNLLRELGELELLYTDPTFMKEQIGFWSQKQLKKWQDLYDTTVLDYDPISNYDRREKWTDTTEGGESVTNTPNTTNTLTHSVTAFNSGSLQDANQDISSTSGTDKTVSALNNTVNREGHAYGNIGVTSSQQLIEAQRKVVEFNIYDYIIQDFRDEFCLLIY